jgi:hypothetical protein
MKMYAIVNHQYLSDKQCGIQSIHACSEFFAQYYKKPRSKEFKFYTEWATKHKTVIMVRGGNCVTLKKTFKKLTKMATSLGIPVVKFHEDEMLNRAVTSVGVVFPTREQFKTKAQLEAYDKLNAELFKFQLL